MNELTLKLEQVSKDLSLQQAGVILSLIQSVIFGTLVFTNTIQFDSLSPINILFMVIGGLIIVVSGSITMTIKQVFAGFNFCRRVFPYYLLDILFGGAMGLLIGWFIIQMPAIPCVYNYIRNKE